MARQRTVAATPLAATPAVMPELGDATKQFLVHAESGEIVLKSCALIAARVLVPHADAALYDAALELVWFLDAGNLSVLDLRIPGTRSVVIAAGVPDTISRFSIAHPAQLAETEDDCDLDRVSLDWDETPTVRVFLMDAPQLRIENAGWLRAQLARPLRAVGKRRGFSSVRVQLPRKLLNCEDAEFCGTTVAFGARDLQLVRVLDRMGGDCMHRACLLRDPRTRLFASPPTAKTWAPVENSVPGPCGLFMFDQVQTAFLLEHKLCIPEGRCLDLGGYALGWLVPGDTVGAPGVGDFVE